MASGLRMRLPRLWSRARAVRFVFRSLAFSGFLLAVQGPTFAVNYSWLGGSGSWGTNSNWTPNGVPTTNDTADVSGPNGTVVNLLTSSGSSGVAITVRSGNTLLGNGAESTNAQRLGNGSILTNQGTIENAVIQTGSTVANTGLIQANGAGKYMNLSQNFTINNSNGSLRAVNGGIVNVVNNNAAGVTVSGGTLSVDSTSQLRQIGGANTLTLSNLSATNSGTVSITMNVDGGGASREGRVTLSGTTTFDNFGTINISLVSPTGSGTGTRTAQITTGSTAAFTNRSTATLNILNSTTATAGTTAAYFQMNATGFNNDGAINITTTGSSAGTAQFRAPTVGFSNAGAINVDGPLSSIQMAGQTFTQTAGSLSLINGGMMTAGSVLINGGALRGTGTIAAPVTIGGVLAPGNAGIGTLSVSNNVTWNAGNSWLFQLGDAAPTLAGASAATDSDLLNVGGAFVAGTGTSFTFDFGGTGSDGWYKLVDYTSTSFSTGTNTQFSASNLPSGKTATFVVDSGSSAVYVQIVPEPATIVLAGMGVVFAGLVARQRRRV